jgi:DNA-binding response OmpR family regulator
MESFQVFTAENARQGLDLVREQKPDLVICDVMMPGLDGYGVLRELRAMPATATLPFIFLTAKGDKLDLRRGMNSGADDYLTKPVLREDLLAAIQSRLTRHRAQEAALKRRRRLCQLQSRFQFPRAATRARPYAAGSGSFAVGHPGQKQRRYRSIVEHRGENREETPGQCF